jgi:hypothetical protein
MFGDFRSQRFTRLKLSYFGFEGELDANFSDSLLAGLRIKDRLSEVAEPLLSAQRDPSFCK